MNRYLQVPYVVRLIFWHRF